MEEAKGNRTQKKRALTTRINAIGRYIAEECESDFIEEKKDQLKNAFRDFELSHETYETHIKEEKDKDDSEEYFAEVQAAYVNSLKAANDYKRVVSSRQVESLSNEATVTANTNIELKIAAMNLPKLEIEPFNGDPMKYHSFMATFQETVEKYCEDGGARLTRLLQYTEGQAKKAICACAVIGGNTGYREARDILLKRFGHAHIVSEAMTAKLRTKKAAHRSDEIQELADDLVSCFLTLRETGRLHEIDTQNTIMDIVGRLPRYIQNKWKTEAIKVLRKEGNYPGIKELVKFIKEIAEEVNDPVYGFKADDTKRKPAPPTRTYVTHDNMKIGTLSMKCQVCSQSHGIWTCDQFRQMAIPKRWEVAKEYRLCFRCLGRGHGGKLCVRSRRCGLDGCQSSHHRLLHDSKKQSSLQDPMQPATMERGKETTMLATSPSLHKVPNFVSLRTVPVYLSNGRKHVIVNALIDEASTKTYLNTDIAAELGLKGDAQELIVNVLNGQQEKMCTSIVDFTISSLDGKVTKIASAYTTERVTGRMPVIDWNEHKSQWRHLQNIEFPDLGPRPIIDLLIGVDCPDLVYSIQDIRGQPGEPIARLTPLGWTCIGACSPDTKDNTFTTNFTYFAKDLDNVDTLLRRYWDIEETGTGSCLSPDNRKAEEIVCESIKYKDGRYTVGMPWKTNQGELEDNYEMAKKRLESTENRLKRTPEAATEYNNIIQDYQKKGYIRKVEPDENKPDHVWYLPHFPVVRPDKETTKTRIVFDASAKYRNVALNDVIYQGPKLQNDLSAVLLRFRRHPIALMSDVKEMYLQIGIAHPDRSMHRFLWRGLDTTMPPQTYEFNRLVFGVNSSPFQAQFVVRHHAEMHKAENPRGAEAMLKSTYMDDTMDSEETPEAALKLYSELIELWNSAGMCARKWLSNSQEVMRHIPQSTCAADVDLDRGELPTVKTLGLLWSPKSDEFLFRVLQPSTIDAKTKRAFLKKIAALFDPLGFLSPYTVRAKIIYQAMWTSGVEWDEPLPINLANKAQKWFDELSDLSCVKINRCIREDKKIDTITMHTFVDASQESYGAVVYMRYAYEDGSVSCRLVASKSRVAPLKAVSIPRLELMAAVVGLQVAEAVGKALDIDKTDWVFWSDSMDVLYWIRGQSRQFKPFVANRVGTIQQSTNPHQWRHVPTKLNPADILSRGASVSTLKEDDTWWNGPRFLMNDESEWPENKLGDKGTQTEMRGIFLKENTGMQSHTHMAIIQDDRLDPERYSDWNRLLRITAWVLRFVDNCRFHSSDRMMGGIAPSELVEVENIYIKRAQMETYPEEYKALETQRAIVGSSKLLHLNPVMDEYGLIRCDGRLRYAEYLAWETRYPIILPKDHKVTSLIIKDSHERNHHAGTNHVLADLSSQYWIVSAREAIRKFERACMTCKRNKAMPGRQIMAPLPEQRLSVSMRAFVHTSVDYAGPFITRQGRGKARQKRYLCLFTCFATRAVHFEMANSLDTDSFLNAFFRMTSRRGMPAHMYSDNGTNFVGGNNELRELVDLQERQIQDATSKYGITWHFNPPDAPHFGGIHETMVKAAKRAIKAILGTADITDEELQSAVVGAEGLVNSRPLTYQSASSSDLVPLTPNHFLFGQLGGTFAPEIIDQTPFNPRRRWRRVQELVRHFWHRWIREWIPGLNPRNKWCRSERDFRTGDVVLILSADAPRGSWPLGRIVRTYPGQDDRIRVVDVKVKNTILKRPVSKLCLLEANEKDK